jgi:hypothetical protein
MLSNSPCVVMQEGKVKIRKPTKMTLRIPLFSNYLGIFS